VCFAFFVSFVIHGTPPTHGPLRNPPKP
jgi:hypothetical protein